jgi:uncharacterized protein (TIGR03067 family)
MSLPALAVLATCLTVAPDAPKEEAVAKELEKLQGTWRLVSAETDGKKAPEEQIKKVKVVINGSKHSVYFGDDVVAHEIPFTLDPTKKPKTTDDQLPDGKVIHGIYELDGDVLKSCVAAPNKDRPTEFASKPGTGHTLRIFKREKPGKESN